MFTKGQNNCLKISKRLAYAYYKQPKGFVKVKCGDDVFREPSKSYLFLQYRSAFERTLENSFQSFLSDYSLCEFEQFA